MAEQRKNRILTLLREYREIKLNQLHQLIPDVSQMTLRRDLDTLARQGLIVRTHGGAREIDPSVPMDEYELKKRMITNTRVKKEVAQRALELLEENRSIYMDAGSTLLTLAQMMPDLAMYVVTNSPNIGIELARRHKTQTILLGGTINKSVVSITGALALDMLKHLNIDIAFIATGGFSVENGFTNAHHNECELKRRVITMAKKVYVLLDHTKIGRNMPFTFATLEDVDAIITDRPLPAALAEEIAAIGVEVHTWEQAEGQ